MSLKSIILLLALVVVAWVCVAWRAPAIERAIQKKAQGRLHGMALSAVSARADGRDVELTGTIPDGVEADAVVREVDGLWGVRRVKANFTSARSEPTEAELDEPGPPSEPPSPPPEPAANAAPIPERTFEDPKAKALHENLKAALERRRIEFLLESDEISPEGLGAVDAVAKILREDRDFVVEIQGHADSTGSEAFNLRLSEQRAQSVVRALIERGIEPKRLVPLGFGSSRPIASNDTEEGRAKNRRIEFHVLEEATFQ
ncbi:MAG: OmpA family protein [Myxococcota bacterium]